MRTNIISACVVLFLSFFCSAQVNNNDVLFTVEKTPVTAKEFIRVYNKNLSLVKDESQKDVDEYLKLFVNYKLKLAEARALEFDKKPQYVNELKGYRKQLAKNYLTDKEVTEALINEAYERMQYDVNAQHVLIRLDASEEDTLVVYNNLSKLRDRFKTENFDTFKSQVHNGNTVLVEDLGYFSSFKMVYDFENKAYNTKVGEVSMPFRTQFGYHIVKVLDKRKSRGEVTVGHIMISNKQRDTSIVPNERIKEINNLLSQGQEFESLAKQFSDDKSSARKGGKLTAFKAGQLSSSTFEDVAFGLTLDNPVSKPFQSEYGWHIIKLYEKKPVGKFDELKYELEQLVSRDSRSRLINTSMINKLKKQYNVSNVFEHKEYFTSILTPDFYSRKWVAPEDLDKDKELLSIKDKKFTYGEFAQFLRSQQKGVKKGTPFTEIVDKAYDAFIGRSIMKYHEENLENANEEFANILKEYREGLLLFDLMETKIWNAVKEDTVGIKKFYEKNKQNYKQEKQIEAIVATATKKSDIKEAKKLLEKGKSVDEIKKKLNDKANQKVIFTTGKMFLDHQALPENLKVTKGLSEIYEHNDAFHIVKINEIFPEHVKEFEDARGMIISDYQEEVEKQWLEELRKKYKVKLNNKVLEKVKAEIKK